jgi:hypothetical protein
MNRRPLDPQFWGRLWTHRYFAKSPAMPLARQSSACHPRATRNKLRTLLGELQRQAYVDA